MRRRLAGLIPSPEVASLLFGLLTASAINVLTSLGLGSVPLETLGQARGVGAGLSVATLGSGILAVVSSRCKEEALLSGAGALSRLELRSQVREELSQRAAAIGAGLAALVGGLLMAVVFVVFAKPMQAPGGSPPSSSVSTPEASVSITTGVPRN